LAELLWCDNNDDDNKNGDGQVVQDQKKKKKQEMPFGFLKMDIFRMKGVMAVQGSKDDENDDDQKDGGDEGGNGAGAGGSGCGRVSAFKHVLQAVHGLFEVTRSGEKWCDDDGDDSSSSSSDHNGRAAAAVAAAAAAGTEVPAVGSAASPSLLSPLPSTASAKLRLVVIGRHLDRRKLEHGLDSCCVPWSG
jgi:hypothetical protein